MSIINAFLVGGALVGGGLLVFKYRKRIGLGKLGWVWQEHENAAKHHAKYAFDSAKKARRALQTSTCQVAQTHFNNALISLGQAQAHEEATGADVSAVKEASDWVNRYHREFKGKCPVKRRRGLTGK